MIDGPSLPWPMESGGPDCRAHTSEPGSITSGTSCGGDAVFAVEVRYPYDGSVWLAFLCERHGPEVPGSRPLSAADSAENDRRRREYAEALAGHPYERTAALRPGRKRRS